MSVLRQYAPSWLVQMPALVPPAEREALQRTVGHPVQRRMLRELTEALDALTTERPLVLVLEDLHWSDRATLEWLAYSARRPDPARLLLLGTYRPVDDMVQAHPLRAVLTELQQHGQCVELALDYLSEAEVMAYLRQRFGGTRLAADLARVLHQRTHGNPLFLIAVVDEIVRQQVMREGSDEWDMRGGVETIPVIIPATLRALLEHQLAYCSPETQTLLAAASVAGVEFAAAAVAAGLERAEEEIEARCATLAHQGQFLQARGRAEWPDGTVTACYSFIHTVYQEVLYQRIPAGRQSRWHARIGARLAQGFGAQAGDLAAALAQHFVRGRMMSQAVQYAQQAGQTAARRAAYQEAVTYYEQALHALQQLPATPDRLAQAIDLRLALQDVLFPLGTHYGTHDRIIDTLREAERLAEALGDHQRLGWVCAELSASYRQINAYEQAVALAQRAVTLAIALGDSDLHAWAALRLGQVAYFQGDYPHGSACFREAVAFSAAHIENTEETTFLPAHARSWLVYCLTQRGEFSAGLALGTEAVRLAEDGDFPSSRGAAYASCGNLCLIRGDLTRAIAFLEGGLDLCRRWHNLDWLPEAATSLGLAYALAGRLADACPLLEQVVAQAATTQEGYKAIWLVKLSQAYLLTGRQEEARTQAERDLVLARERQERGCQAWALRFFGEIYTLRKPPAVELAEDHYRQALTLADELGMRPLQARCHCGLGMLYLKTQRQDQARTALATAIALYRAMGMTFWLPQAEAAMGNHARTMGGE